MKNNSSPESLPEFEGKDSGIKPDENLEESGAQEKDGSKEQEEEEYEIAPEKLEKQKVLVLQERIGRFFDEIRELGKEEYESLKQTGKLPNNKLFQSAALGKLTPTIAQKLISFFDKGKTPHEIAQENPWLMEIFAQQITTEALQRLKKEEEREKSDDDDDEDEETKKELTETIIAGILVGVLAEAEYTSELTRREEFIETARNEAWSKISLLFYRHFDALERDEYESLKQTGARTNGNYYEISEFYEEPIEPGVVKIFTASYPKRMNWREIRAKEPDITEKYNQIRRIDERIMGKINAGADIKFPKTSA